MQREYMTREYMSYRGRACQPDTGWSHGGKDGSSIGFIGGQRIPRKFTESVASGASQAIAKNRHVPFFPRECYPLASRLFSNCEQFWTYDGSMLCLALSSTDITEQVQLKRAQDESEGRLRALTIASTDVVYRTSPDWTQMW